ncbi:basic proline-rich protein-like [Pseudopipra pipra]|uniref:basic proline-rich protein-like n=1 Tax=Pseudopipra pipra TaxID=415032 RepID=UPI0031395741
MPRERSARRKTEGGDGARQEDRDKDRGQDRDRDRRSEDRCRAHPSPASPPVPRQRGREEPLRAGRWGRARRGRSGRGSAGARSGENGGAFVVSTRSRGWDRPGRGDTPGRPRDPPEEGCRPYPPRDRSFPARAPPRPPHPLPGRTSPVSPLNAAPGGSHPQGPPGTRDLGPAGAPATGPLRPRGAGGLPGREERRQPFPRSSRAPGPRAELLVCPRVPVSVLRRPQELALTVPRVGHRLLPALPAELRQLPTAVLCPAIHKTGKALPGRETATGEETKKCSNRMVLRESKEGQDRGQIQSGNELLFNLCRSPSQPRAGGSAAGWAVPGWGRAPIHHCPAQGGFPAPSGLHPTAAKVLVRHPSSFPGIKEPNESGGIPRSEAKAFGRVSPPGPACGGASPPDLEPWLLPGKPGVKVAALRGKIRAPGGTGRLFQQEFGMELRAVNCAQASPPFPIQAGSARALGTDGSGWAGTESRTWGRVDQLPREHPGDEATGSSFQSREHILSLAEAGSQSRSRLARLGGSSWIHSGGKPLCLPGALTLFVLPALTSVRATGRDSESTEIPNPTEGLSQRKKVIFVIKRLKKLLKILGQQSWDSQET